MSSEHAQHQGINDIIELAFSVKVIVTVTSAMLSLSPHNNIFSTLALELRNTTILQGWITIQTHNLTLW
jgi:uncharacterized membrane protein